MNKAFKKPLFKWYGSRFYKAFLGPSLTYNKWVSMQPKSVVDSIYGKDSLTSKLINKVYP